MLLNDAVNSNVDSVLRGGVSQDFQMGVERSGMWGGAVLHKQYQNFLILFV